MAVELAAAYVSLVPSAAGIQGSITRQLAGLPSIFGKVGDQAGAQMEKGVKNRIGNVTKLIGAVGVGTLLRGAFQEAQEAQKIGAQTTQVIKSTGSAAGVTADQVGALSGEISRYAGIDDEAIQAGENLLLTFTNVRNEAGKGNDVFNQATKIMVDMSVAMGTDAKGGAIQLGKALNDPVKGITALTRVGVTFTQQQKDQIKTFVETGRTLEAQKIILAELNKEFGGSAAAQATAADKAKVAWGNLQEQLGTALMPVFTAVANVISGKVVPALSATIGFVGRNATTFKILGGVVLATWAAFKGYTIIRAAISALGLLSARYKQYVAQLSYGNAVQRAASSGLQGITSGSLRTKGALLAVGIATAALTKHWMDAKKRQAELKAVTDDYVGTLQQSKGAIDDQVVAIVTQKLASDGAYTAAIKYGISQSLVTQAALGNKDAIDQLTKSTEGNVGAMKNVLSPALEQAFGLKTASEQYKQSTSQTSANTTATNANAAAHGGAAPKISAAAKAQRDAARAAADATRQMQYEGDAAGLLKQALDRLNGKTLDVNDANVQFHSRLLSVISALKENGTTLDLNTAAGVANNEALSGAIRAAQAHAEAVSGGTELTEAGTQAYRNDLIALRDRVKAFGGNTTEIQKMIDKMGQVPKVLHTKAEMDTAEAKRQANVLAEYYKATLGSVTTYAQIASNVFQAGERGTAGVFGHNASGTDNWRGGPTWVGEHGRELVNLPRGAQVMDNRRSEKFAASRGDVNLTLNSYNTIPQPEYVSAVARLRDGAAELGRL